MTEPTTDDVQEPTAERSDDERVAERDQIETLTRSSGPFLNTRAQAIYGRDALPLASGEQPNFFADAYQAWRGDSDAAERQTRHYAMLHDVARQMERASDVLASEIPGMYPNDYLPGLLTPRVLKGRPMGGFYQKVAIADARPRVFAKVTTSGTVSTAADGAAFTATDIATTSVTTTPTLYGTYTDISRAAFDGGDPSTQSMVYQDLVEAYAQASETAIKTAVEAGSTDSGIAITAATPFAGALANVIGYYSNRFRACEGIFVPSAAFSTALAEADTTGRPKMPLLNPSNSDGTAAPGGARGSILDATTFLSYASTVNVWVFARPEDFVIFESPVVQFSFEQAAGGPHAVRVGVWAYLGIGARLGSYKKTAA